MKKFNSLKDFYTSKIWAQFRNWLILKRLNERCETIDELTGQVIVNKNDIVLHHIKPLTPENVNDYNISLNPDNIKIVSQRSHNDIHKRFAAKGKHQVYLVYGPPCSGKTSYVKAVAGPNDLIVDVDSIWECISNNPRYTKPNALKRNVFKIRDELLDQIKTRMGNFENAYIIGTYPLCMDRRRLKSTMDCEIIFMNKDKNECLKNLYNDKNRDFKTWKVFINEWFERYQAD